MTFLEPSESTGKSDKSDWNSANAPHDEDSHDGTADVIAAPKVALRRIESDAQSGRTSRTPQGRPCLLVLAY